MKTRIRTKGIIAATTALTVAATGLVTHWEGRSLRAYYDIVGVATICDGETKGVKIGDIATPEQCDDMLARNLAEYEAGLDNCLTAAIPPEAKIAFLSWTYNVGIAAACRSTLVRLANAGDIRGACDQLLRWNRAGRPLRVVRGLTNRRQAERELCLAGLA